MNRTVKKQKLTAIVGALVMSAAALALMLALLGAGSIDAALASKPDQPPVRSLAAGPGDVFGPDPIPLYSNTRETTNQQAGICAFYPMMIPASELSGQQFGDYITIPVDPADHDVPGHFGFVQWDSSPPPGDPILEDDLLNPGNVVDNYLEPNSNPPDTQLDIGDWILANPGAHTAVEDELNGLIGTEMLLPVWHDADCLMSGQGTCSNAVGSGQNAMYRTYTFVRMILTEVNFTGHNLKFQFVGFENADTSQCSGSVSSNGSGRTGDLDVIVVMDVTGSMEFDTICYGCWERYVGNDKYKPYPLNGLAFPLDYDTLKDPYICGNGGDCNTSPHVTPGDPKPEGANDYIIIEAELYSNNNSIWDPAFRGADVGYWAMQRSGSSAKSVDSRSAFVRHHPYFQASDSGEPFGHRYWLADAQSGTAPRLEYDFMPTWSSGDTYIYLRVQAFSSSLNDNPDNAIYWAVDNGTIQEDLSAPTSGDYQGDNNNWGWIKLNAGNLNENQIHTLKIWAGSPGYALDRIIITAQDTNMGSNSLRNYPVTPGTAQRMAADRCNPIYGESVLPTDCSFIQLPVPGVNNLNDPLFGDLQPIRGSKEAIKSFVDRLNPTLDQAGFVKFSSNADQMAQLECLIASGVREANSTGQIDNYPLDASVLGEFDETACYDENQAEAGTQPIRSQNILLGIENTSPSGSTDIADGLRRGLHMLGVTTDDDGLQTNDCDWDLDGSTWEIGGQTQPATNISSHCSRGAAATQAIVLLTDGAPTDMSPGDNNDCIGAIDPLPYEGFPNGDKKFQCIIYYADIAAANGIPVCTIGLGPGTDPDLLNAVAERTNGQYYFAPSYAQLDLAPDAILNSCLDVFRADLAITKTAPLTTTAGDLITYTLTITNSGTAPATDLVITDVIPTGANYITGGVRIGDVVSWTVPVVPVSNTVQVGFVVTATTTITNSDYRVSAAYGYSATGNEFVVTSSTQGVYLPIILKQ